MRKAEYRDIVILLRATTNYADSFVAELSARNIPVFADVNSDIYIPKSDIVNLIKTNVEGVDGVNAYFLSEMNETALQTKQYVVDNEVVTLSEGENPNLGLDNHGNIYLESDNQFPVLMGGWDYLNSKHDEVDIIDPLIIVFE